LTGGGFGGFTVSLIERNNFSNWYSKILSFYPAEKIFEVN
jgi:galactokinase